MHFFYFVLNRFKTLPNSFLSYYLWRSIIILNNCLLSLYLHPLFKFKSFSLILASILNFLCCCELSNYIVYYFNLKNVARYLQIASLKLLLYCSTKGKACFSILLLLQLGEVHERWWRKQILLKATSAALILGCPN